MRDQCECQMLERVGVAIVKDFSDDVDLALAAYTLPHGLSTAPFTVDHAHANGYPVASTTPRGLPAWGPRSVPGSVPKQFFCFHTASNFLERAGTMTKFLVLFNQTRRERR